MRFRISLAAALAGLLLITAAPVAAQDHLGRYNGQCRKLTKQISRYQDVADMARERQNQMWLASTAAHIERLRDRRSRLCPQYDEFLVKLRNEEFWRETYALTIAGAKAAARYFTFGTYQGF